jgi:hypothetical protein
MYLMTRLFPFIGLVPVALLLGSCGGGNGSSGTTPPPATPAATYTAKSGVAQKGPLIKGSTVTAQELDASLSPTGKEYSYQTTSDLGQFSPTSTFSSQYIGLNATGYYFDEVANAVSTGTVTLNGYSDLTAVSVLNVNLLTTLTYQRIQHLVTSSSMAFAAATTQAENEVLLALGIPSGNYGSFSALDLSGSTDGDHILAAISSLFAYGNSSGPLSSLIASFQGDIGANGAITNSATVAALAAAAKTLNPTAIAANLTNQYSSDGITFTATDISDWIDQDGDGVIGRYKYSKTHAALSTSYSSPDYTVGAASDNARATTSAGTLIVNGATAPTAGVAVHTDDVLTIALTSGTAANQTVSAYVLLNGSRVARFSVTTTPLSLTLAETIGSNGAPQSVQITDDGKTLLVATGDSCSVTPSCASPSLDGGLYTYDLSTPAAPALSAHISHIDNGAYSWVLYYSVAYSAASKTAFVSTAIGALQAFDVSTPTSPVFDSATSIGSQALAVALSKDGVSAFVSDATDYINQFNISNPSAPTLVLQTLINGVQVHHMAASPDGTQLLLFGQGYVAVVDTSSGMLGAVTQISQNSGLSGFANGIYLDTRVAVLVGPTGATIVDLTMPSAPSILGSVADPNAKSVIGVDGAVTQVSATGLLYVVANNFLYVLNASDRSKPFIEGSVALSLGSSVLNSPSVAATSDGKVAYAVSQGRLNVITVP